MDGVIVCSVKEAMKLLEHMDDDDMVTLTVLSRKPYIHSQAKRIKKNNGKDLINKANIIEYQDNDIFGRLSLYGVVKEKDVIHNLLFPQIE